MKTILIIDDEAEIRELLTIYLTNHGYATITAGNGAEAMTILQEQSIDLVIADIMMPQMDGLELLKKHGRIRKFRFSLFLPSLTIWIKSTACS